MNIYLHTCNIPIPRPFAVTVSVPATFAIYKECKQFIATKRWRRGCTILSKSTPNPSSKNFEKHTPHYPSVLAAVRRRISHGRNHRKFKCPPDHGQSSPPISTRPWHVFETLLDQPSKLKFLLGRHLATNSFGLGRPPKCRRHGDKNGPNLEG